MSILIDKSSRVVTQGITGSTGRYHTRACVDYGYGEQAFVAGVTPGKGGTMCDKIPVFNTVSEARKETGCNVSVVYVPPAHAAGAIDEAVDAGIELIICITEGVPLKDMLLTRHRMSGKATVLVGPNCPGIITPDQLKIGIMPGYIHQKGSIGVVSRSGTLTYEVVHQLSQQNLGQSTCVGIGGDPINGLKHLDVMRLFNEDPDTEAVVLCGEIGGSDEE
ncbi:MAG: succinate--CoA ligase subunit alpha, partial [Pseudomonadota bacterium]